MGETRGSCATGYDRKTIVRAAGEALERQVSFGKMPPASIHHRLCELDEEISSWFNLLFDESTQPDLPDHPFACVDAYRLSDKSSVVVPAVPFTLAPHPDSRFLPKRDSSGCAIHTDANKALETAVSELAERQGLTLFWYFGHLNQATEIHNADTEFEADNETSRIVRWFLSEATARVFLFDVSIIAPYRSILAVYINTGGPVYFAAGGSASRNSAEAVKKALIELYQAYVLTYQSLRSDQFYDDFSKSSDDITNGYLSFNNSDSARKFTELAKGQITRLSYFQENKHRSLTSKAVEVLVHQQKLSFGRQLEPLTYVSTLCIPGFPRMSIDGPASKAELQAAKNYGFDSQIQTGAVPFA